MTNYNIIRKYGWAATLLAFSWLLSAVSCSDEWNDHYDASKIENGTLWQAVSTQPQLTHFASVVKACGYDIILDGSQTFSVFAPTDDTFSQSEADSLIREYQRQQAAGIRTNDNSVVRQFLHNHIALYKYPVSTLTNDSITMMNSKYEVLTATGLGNRSFLTKNTLYDNGLLYTLDRKLDYFPNVYEYLGHDHDLDSVYQFFSKYSVYEFNDAKSVPGEIVDGMTVYLDSVSELRNPLFDTYGQIDNEDSTYWMVCPVNAEWERIVKEYEPYFNYSNNIAKRDSMVYTATRMAMMGGAFFSRTINPDEAFADSAISTQATSYSVRRLLGEENAYYTYYKPFAPGGVFDGTEDVVCSNGHVRKATQFNISKFDTFLQTIKIEAESILSQDTIIDAVDPLTVREVTSDNPFYGQVSGNAFVEVVPDPATAQVTILYKAPNVLSNVGYDIYAVFVPPTAYDMLDTEDTTKPNIVRTTLYWSDQNGREGRRIFNNNIITNPAVVDTVKLASNFSFPTCSYGLSDAQVKVSIRSNVRPNQTSTYSSMLRLDCIILRPHELDAVEENSNRYQ